MIGRSRYPAVTDDFLEELSKAPEWIEESKKSSCRKGAIQALTLCKTYYPSIESDRLALGFLELKADGPKYKMKEYIQVAKEARRYATKIADEMKLHSFETGYDERKKRRPLPTRQAVSLKVVSKKPHPDHLS